MREDKELQEFRDLMTRPEEYEDGFGWGSVIMAFFVGILMAPAQMYMQLVAGIGLVGAARWVTVILYVEVARRAFKTLKRPEIFVLFYMCGTMMAGQGGLLWRQFIVQSEEIRKLGITDYIPSWYAPQDPDVLGSRSFFATAWLVPIGLLVYTRFVGRLNHFGLGYVMFRLTSDVEQLPFPMAPVSAMGMTALADASNQKDTWRWRTFSTGAVAGIAFGFIYLAIPVVTGAWFSDSLRILPLPFLDLTGYTESFLPAMPMLISFNLGLVVTGMVLPFWAMVGGFIGLIFTIVLNPILYHVGILEHWEQGIGGIQTVQSNYMDFYFSFGMGLALAVALIGFYHVASSFRKKSREMDEAGRPTVEWSRLFKPPAGRGDIPLWVAFAIYFFSTMSYIALGYWLVNYASPLPGPMFPVWLLCFYGFVYTPLISYVSARMEGIVGRRVEIPFLRQATFVLSGYKGAAIWFAPIPFHNYAQQTVFFRVTELTGTKISSLIKAELLIFPVMMIGTVIFCQFIWSIGPVPSEMFPFANEFWELNAFRQGLWWSATIGEGSDTFRQ
ncbi:MAG: OPT family oligopeptide transporter, partial [Planctomycetota bacterium]